MGPQELMSPFLDKSGKFLGNFKMDKKSTKCHKGEISPVWEEVEEVEEVDEVLPPPPPGPLWWRPLYTAHVLDTSVTTLY